MSNYFVLPGPTASTGYGFNTLQKALKFAISVVKKSHRPHNEKVLIKNELGTVLETITLSKTKMKCYK